MSLNSINNLVSGRRHLMHKRDITKEVLVFLIMLTPGGGGCCGRGCRVDRGSDGRSSHRSNYSAGLAGTATATLLSMAIERISVVQALRSM